jgi:OTT_1508-like deaminase
MKSGEMTSIKERAAISEGYGNRQNPFAEVRHYIGRLAYHPKCVRVLMAAASRLSSLFLEPQITPVERPPFIVPSPALRSSVTLEGITKRMISNDDALLHDVRARLHVLDQNFDIETTVRKEYANKNFKPCVHAELVLLEHFWRNRQQIDLFDNDNFIGTSKPACYCCFLYIREHPGRFVEPATHQKIYLNWMPPTSIPSILQDDSELGKHERKMLNNMVKSIRVRVISQIISQTGRRQQHFDSVTGETFSAVVQPDSRATRDSQILQASVGM